MDLYEACENGNEERVVELLVHGEHWSMSHKRHQTQFRYSGNRDSLSYALTAAAEATAVSAGLVSTPSTMLQTRGIAGRTPLHAACLGGQVGVVRLLLGERCVVYFTGRSKEETVELLGPLVHEAQAYAQYGQQEEEGNEHSSQLFQVSMAVKDDGCDLVPIATVQLPTTRIIAPQDLLKGEKHVDDFGNTPLQCVSCFGYGSTVRHIDDALEITKQLLLHGDQPNLPKLSNHWTPLHWSAYMGCYEQTAMLLDPQTYVGNDGSRYFGKTQYAIPLMISSDGLFAVDVAGRSGLTLVDEMKTLRREATTVSNSHPRTEYTEWRLRLDHVEVIKLFVQEFVENARQLSRYVTEMKARVPVHLLTDQQKQRYKFTCADVIRYGQHLLYWSGCFGLVDEVRTLLQFEIEWPLSANSASAAGRKIDERGERVYLRPLYVCSCEENKRQSVLHAVAAHGQGEIVTLLLEKLLYDQQHPSKAAVTSHLVPGSQAGALHLSRTPLANKKNVIIPTTKQSQQPRAKPEDVDIPLERLDVMLLLENGWKNYRNETPLYLAALYLHSSIILLFSRFLSSKSLQWELANCNVEGSFVHHIANETTRQILHISSHTKLVCAEYVLLFDGVTKKQFKESVIETLKEESASTPSLAVIQAGQRLTPRSWFQSTAKLTDYLVVGATEDVLIRHAQALHLKVKHRGSSIRSKYNASKVEVFEPFRSLQRQQVVLDIIQKNINLKKHLRKQNLAGIFPLHDASGCRNIVRHWVYTDTNKRIFQPFTGNSVSQFLLERRTHQYDMLWPLLTYFGEKHAFYYAFVSFYTVWLLLIALPGTICQLIWFVDDVHFVSPLFAIVVSIWATLVVERWKRKKSEIQQNFGNFKRNRNEQAPGFYGDFEVQTHNTSIFVDVNFPKSLQLVRIYCGIPLLLTMAACMVSIFVGVKMSTASSIVLHDALLPWLPAVLIPYITPILNAISMLILDNLYTRIALALTRWENHRTVWQHESMLAQKLFWFKFLNAFISLFWVAFVDQDAVALRKQLIIIMGVRQIWYTLMRNVFPILHVQYKWRRAGLQFSNSNALNSSQESQVFTLTHEWYDAELTYRHHQSPSDPITDHRHDASVNPVVPPPLVLVQELMQPPDFLMGKQMEIILQFGYITMFVSVLPIAPLLALISNVINTRLDVLSCTQVKQRAPFESETEISTFISILEFMSFAAVAVNCSVLFFTAHGDFESLLRLAIPDWTDDAMFYLEKLWILLAIEHVVLGAKATLSLTIDDAAAWVQLDEDRSDDKEKKQKEAAQQDLRNDHLNQLETHSTQGIYSKFSQGDEEQVLDQLLIEAARWKKKNNAGRLSSSSFCSTLNSILADKYTTVVRERDEAIRRERLTEQKLQECMKRLEQLQQQKPLPDIPVASSIIQSDEEKSASTWQNMAHRTGRGDVCSASTRQCFLCYTFKNVSIPPMKRCLSCRVFLCSTCDEILHLDDLGVKEPVHFRVQVPLAVLSGNISANKQRASIAIPEDTNSRMVSLEKSSHIGLDMRMLNDLRQLVKEFVNIRENEIRTEGNCNLQPSLLTEEELYQRSLANPPLALRFLRNTRRQREHKQVLF